VTFWIKTDAPAVVLLAVSPHNLHGAAGSVTIHFTLFARESVLMLHRRQYFPFFF
jgi:hypothetical protein